MMKWSQLIAGLLGGVWGAHTVFAGTPVWTFEALTPTVVEVPENTTSTVQYRVTNQSSKTHTLFWRPIQGVAQVTGSVGLCGSPFILSAKASCILSLEVTGSQIPDLISDGPLVCQKSMESQCYRPARADILQIKKTSPLISADISIIGSPLLLTANGPSGQLTVQNNSTNVTATNIASNFVGTALEGEVTESANDCDVVLPGASCTLTFVPGNNPVAQTDFPVQGTNTNIASAAMQIQVGTSISAISPNVGPVVGGTGVVITGNALSGAYSVTFDGINAVSFHVVNATTINAVAPPHGAGAVDVVVQAPLGTATLSNGYTYQPNAAGAFTSGGAIGCLGPNLVVSLGEVGDPTAWSVPDDHEVAFANSFFDGAANSSAILADATLSSSAAEICSAYERDSQGNYPCQPGFTCYSDWFLPSQNQLLCLDANYISLQSVISSQAYWSSTQDIMTNPATNAFLVDLGTSGAFSAAKLAAAPVLCVRAL